MSLEYEPSSEPLQIPHGSTFRVDFSHPIQPKILNLKPSRHYTHVHFSEAFRIQDPTVRICLGPYDGPGGGWLFVISEVSLYFSLSLSLKCLVHTQVVKTGANTERMVLNLRNTFNLFLRFAKARIWP